MTDETYYELLGVSQNATPEEIKSAYWDLLKKIHPDTVATLSLDLKREAAEVTREIIEAYSVLSDTIQRAQYDRELAKSRPQAATAASSPPNSAPRRGFTRSSLSQDQARRTTLVTPRLLEAFRRWIVRHPAPGGFLGFAIICLAAVIVLIIGLALVALFVVAVLWSILEPIFR